MHDSLRWDKSGRGDWFCVGSGGRFVGSAGADGFACFHSRSGVVDVLPKGRRQGRATAMLWLVCMERKEAAMDAAGEGK
jgi:hypothetical protein